MKKFGIRSKDLIARFDQNQFVVLLSDIGKKDLIHIAQDIHRSLELLKTKNTCLKDETKLVFSLGLSITLPDLDQYKDFLINKTQKALSESM